MGYGEYVTELKRARETRTKNIEFVRALITLHPAIRAILTARTFRGFQFSEVLGIDRTEAAKILSELITRGLVTMTSQAAYKTESILNEIARQMSIGGE
jgi:predicted transcriptional regulator